MGFWLLLASFLSLQLNTTLVLGLVERDLTGDGKPEILRVIATGPTRESLDPIFTIESAGRTIYRYRLESLTRTVRFDAGRHVISAERYEAQLKEFARWFFAEEKFQRPAEFLDSLRVMARLSVPEIPNVIARDQEVSDPRDASEIWDEILKSRVTVFTFSPGGDRVVAIGWSERAGRFYRLLECC